jgi:hypothetical protein
MLVLVLYLAALVWCVVRVSNRLALLSWSNRTAGARLAGYCGRNFCDPSMPAAAPHPLHSWAR